MATGFTTSGSAANNRASKPAGRANFFCASAGGRGGDGAGVYGPVSCRPAARIVQAARRNEKNGTKIFIGLSKTSSEEQAETIPSRFQWISQAAYARSVV